MLNTSQEHTFLTTEFDNTPIKEWDIRQTHAPHALFKTQAPYLCDIATCIRQENYIVGLCNSDSVEIWDYASQKNVQRQDLARHKDHRDCINYHTIVATSPQSFAAVGNHAITQFTLQ